MNRLRQIIRAIIISWIIFFIGVAGYMMIERWNFLDAAYMTALTVTTVGFMEIHEPSDAGKMLFNPHFETLIEPLDTVIVMGKTPDLKKFANAVNLKGNF